MKNILSVLFAVGFSVLFVFTGSARCEIFENKSDLTMDAQRDFHLRYSYANHLMGVYFTIDVTPDSVFYNYRQYSKVNSKSFAITNEEAEHVYCVLKEQGIDKMMSPPGVPMLDAPEQSILAALDGRKVFLQYGTVRDVPVYIKKTETAIFDLLTKYYPGWKKEVRFE